MGRSPEGDRRNEDSLVVKFNMEGVEFEFDGNNLTWHLVSSYGLEADMNKSLYGKAFVKGSGMYNFEKQKGGGVNFRGQSEISRERQFKRTDPEIRHDRPIKRRKKIAKLSDGTVDESLFPSDQAMKEIAGQETKKIRKGQEGANND